MELVKHGKTKDVYKLSNGNFLLKFKDTVTGWASTGEEDSGGNQVVGEKSGVGLNSLRVTTYYFNLLNKNKVPTHFVGSDLVKQTMEVKGCKTFGFGLEWVVRFVAAGSFIKRYGSYIDDGASLGDGIVELTIKDDDRDDPPITREIAVKLGIIAEEEYQEILKLTRKTAKIVRDDFASKGMELYDIKFEFGKTQDGKIVLIDEVSPGNLRAYRNGTKMKYEEVAKYFA